MTPPPTIRYDRDPSGLIRIVIDGALWGMARDQAAAEDAVRQYQELVALGKLETFRDAVNVLARRLMKPTAQLWQSLPPEARARFRDGR